jgi:hypothetical protein
MNSVSNFPAAEAAMQDLIRVQITKEDIEIWQSDQKNDPLLRALKRATQTPWRMAEINMAVERVAPFRTLILRSEVLSLCREYKITRTLSPFEFETELISPFTN